MANMLVKVVRVLLNYAVENELRRDNPAQRIKPFKLGEHRAWTDAECAAFEARWPAGSMPVMKDGASVTTIEGLAADGRLHPLQLLARFTGQRCGDVANMTRAHRKDGAIRVVQQKTGAELWVPEHRDLAAQLALDVADHMSLLTKPDGSAFDPKSLSVWFGETIEEAGLSDECVMHGLRKTAARTLAEVGCTTGHKSLVEVERYARAADQKRPATAAIHRLEQNGNRTGSGKRPREKW